MTYQEYLDIVYTSDEIYRPPIEANSVLVELTEGCTWGKCEFCDYVKDEYKLFPIDRIQMQTQMLTKAFADKTRLFLMGCNPLHLDTDYLLHVIEIARQNLYAVTQVSMYARADDVLNKTDNELLKLKDAGVCDFHIGLESGCDAILSMHKKGETAAMIQEACHKLDALGICYHLTMIPGLGGRDLSWEHIHDTAALINTIKPISIWNIGLNIFENTILEEKIAKGEFSPLSYYEMAIEERQLLELIDLKETCLYVDSTVLGQYTIMGTLPEGKNALLDQLDGVISEGI